jgi:hypothetical protein
MNERAMAELTERVDRLEEEIRRLQRAAVVGLILAVGFFAILVIVALHSVAPSVVEAERFAFRDARGKVRAELAMVSNGSRTLRLTDSEGKVIWQAP